MSKSFAAIRIQEAFRKYKNNRRIQETSEEFIYKPHIKQLYSGHRNARTMVNYRQIFNITLAATFVRCLILNIKYRVIAKQVLQLKPIFYLHRNCYIQIKTNLL